MIFFKVRFFEVGEQASALTDQFVKASFAGEIFRVGFEVVRDILDAFRDERNLHSGGAGVVGAGLEFADDVFSVLHGKYHFFVHLGLLLRDQALFIRRSTEPEYRPSPVFNFYTY